MSLYPQRVFAAKCVEPGKSDVPLTRLSLSRLKRSASWSWVRNQEWLDLGAAVSQVAAGSTTFLFFSLGLHKSLHRSVPLSVNPVAESTWWSQVVVEFSSSSPLNLLSWSFVSIFVCFKSRCRNYSQSVAAVWLSLALCWSALFPLCLFAPRVPAVWVFPSASGLIGGGRARGLLRSSSVRWGSPGCCLEAGQRDRRQEANHQQQFVLAAHLCASGEIHPKTELASSQFVGWVWWP